jgi:RNAse (barnase) inhibitor barstar
MNPSEPITFNPNQQKWVKEIMMKIEAVFSTRKSDRQFFDIIQRDVIVPLGQTQLLYNDLASKQNENNDQYNAVIDELEHAEKVLEDIEGKLMNIHAE